MERRLFLKVVAGQFVLVACGSGKSSSSAAPSSSTTSSVATTTIPATSTSTVPVVTTTTLPAPEVLGGLVRRIDSPKSRITIQYDPGVPEFWLQMIADTLPIGQTELGDSGPIVVHTYSSADFFVPAYAKARNRTEDVVRGALATFRSDGLPGNIWQYLPNHFKRMTGVPAPPTNLLHEYFHTVQGWLVKNRTDLIPGWVGEGSAEFFSYRVGADKGIDTALTPDWANPAITFEQKRQSLIQEYARPIPDPLSQFEDRPATGIRYTAYALGFLATEFLVQRYGTTKTTHDLYAAITPSKDWKQAFSEVFGVTLDQFYAEFEAYRKTL